MDIQGCWAALAPDGEKDVGRSRERVRHHYCVLRMRSFIVHAHMLQLFFDAWAGILRF